MSGVVCGIDSSTQSCTVLTRNPDTGKVLETVQQPHPEIVPVKSEQEPQSWWTALKECMHQIKASEIVSLSIDGQGHGSVLMDKSDQVLRPAKLWNNTETNIESEELIESLGVEHWIKRTCIVPVPAFTITKLLWIERHEPQILRKCAHVILPHDYLIYRFSGNYVTDRSEASGTGYYSPATSTWQLDLLDLVNSSLDWPSMVPYVSGPDDTVGTVHAHASNETSIPKGTLIACGCNDNPASALGLGLKKSDVCISLGTSGTIFTTSENPVFDYTGQVNGNADATGNFLPLICTLNATKVTNWITKLLGIDYDTASSIALSASSSPGRPIMIPYFDGERTPNLPLASGLLSGLRTDTTAGELLRACFEGVLLNILTGLEALEHAGVDTSGRMIITGGGARSPAYVQFLADLSGRPIWVSHETDTAAKGAAVQAAAIFHGCPVQEIRDAWAPSLSIGAEPRNDQSVEELKERFMALAKQEELRATS
jgi:xylulokinase